ncbi:hypothetical protein BDV96DRAFT_581513 [Lophiotrema nucula]|uniref:Uncharacterized protein n=1 Tax=Lophiotrema nucula TaxID=690887 RepID=A0A6A5YYL0_9PLEO|nr:hypothetical protein BDV96DRAFT_581513 [Lophiotrema nucula]
MSTTLQRFAPSLRFFQFPHRQSLSQSPPSSCTNYAADKSRSEYIPPSPESDEQGYYTASEGSQSQGYFTLESSPNHRATESNKVVASHGTSLTTPKFVPLAPAFQPNTTHDGSVDAPLAEDEKDTWYLCRPYDLFGNPFPPTSSTKVDNLAPFSAKLPSSLQAVFTAPLLNCRLRWSDLAYVRRHFRENDGLVRYLQDVLKTLWDDETIVDIGEARAEIQTMLDEHNRSTIALLNWTPCDCYVRPVEDYL